MLMMYFLGVEGTEYKRLKNLLMQLRMVNNQYVQSLSRSYQKELVGSSNVEVLC